MGSSEGDRELRFELSAESRDRDARIGALSYGEGDIPIMRRQGVASAVPDRTRVTDVSIDRARIDAGSIGQLKVDFTVNGLGNNVAGTPRDSDVFVHRVQADPAAGVFQSDRTLNRAQRYESIAAGHVDFAFHRFGRNRCANTVHLQTGVDTREVEPHPGRCADSERYLGGWTVATLGPYTDRSRGGGDLDPVTSGGAGLDSDRVAIPGVHRHVTTKRVDVQPLPTADRDRGIDLLEAREGEGTGDEGE